MSKTVVRHDARIALTELVQSARWRIAALAMLSFCWFMVLPATVWLLSDSQTGVLWAVGSGVTLEIARVIARQQVRRQLRTASMARAAERALRKSSLTSEVLADSAFWSAHIVEYAASIDLPASAGAGSAVLVTLILAGFRTGLEPVAEVAAVLFAALALGVVSNRVRRPGAYAIVDNRERAVTWMAAAVRDRGELASPKASAAFLIAVGRSVGSWCDSEDRVERARTRHRLVIAFLTILLLYAVANLHGFDPLERLPLTAVRGITLGGVALLCACMPAAYALAVHLDSLAIANSELTRITLNAGRPRPNASKKLSPLLSHFCARGMTVRLGERLALDIGDMEISLERPIGIAGPNGSGKTTLAISIAGLVAPTTGDALLDSTPAEHADRDDIAFVPQDPVLIEPLSVLENLRLVAPDFELERALEVLRVLGLTCPLDLPIGNLSRGEQRRIAIARAILKRPKLLVLDEPDAWLDIAGRRALLSTLNEAARTARVVVVSHRPDTLLGLDRVIVLTAEHRVEAIDTPDQLRQRSPIFRALLNEEPELVTFEPTSYDRQAN